MQKSSNEPSSAARFANNCILQMGDSCLMVSPCGDSLPMPGQFYLFVKDPDAMVERAVHHGATQVMKVKLITCPMATAKVESKMSKVTFGGYPSVPRKSPILKSTSSASH